jgi:glycerate kinase
MLSDACDHPRDRANCLGAGAAGGLPFGLMVGYEASVVSGSGLVAAWLNISQRVANADLIITGEGRFDETSLGGKGPGDLVKEATRLGKTIHVFAGSVGVPPASHLHAITPASLPLISALPRTAELLSTALAGSFG